MTKDDMANVNLAVYGIYVQSSLLRLKEFDEYLIKNKEMIVGDDNAGRIMQLSKEIKSLVAELNTIERSFLRLLQYDKKQDCEEKGEA